MNIWSEQRTRNIEMKNSWLQKRQKRQETVDRKAKIDQIVDTVTKYISNRKLKNGK